MRNIMKVLAISSLLLAAFPASAAPQAGSDEGQQRPAMRMQQHRGEMLRRLDKDGNGSVSRDEFMGGAAERFAKMDRNGDGQLSTEDRPQRDGRPGQPTGQGPQGDPPSSGERGAE